MVAKNASTNAPFKIGTVSLTKGEYKLIHYFGHKKYLDQFEMYSLPNDPEEKNNLYSSGFPEAQHMKEELIDALATANKPYLKTQ